MGIACTLKGHLWNGCYCIRCGKEVRVKDIVKIKTQDHLHRIIKEHESPIVRQSACWKVDGSHDWSGCTCSRCGKTRDEAHDLDEHCVCKICGKTLHDRQEVWTEQACNVCGGTGRIKHSLSYGDPDYGNPDYEGDECGACAGTGKTRVGPPTLICKRCGKRL